MDGAIRILQVTVSNDCGGFVSSDGLFFLPSRFEGLPIVGIEAQAAGCPCFFSDTITKEVGITDLAHFISLETPPTEWTEEILEKSQIPRRDTSEEIAVVGYDIECEVKKLEKMYLGEVLNASQR